MSIARAFWQVHGRPSLLLLTAITALSPLIHGLALGQSFPTTEVGRTQGQFGLSHTGAAIYTFPLWTPPGVAGVEPQLALSYNNQSGGSLVSLGWSISGLSQITRCQRTWAQDGQPEAVLLTSADRFCIDGRRLRVTSGAYSQPSSTYQTEVADFSLITARDTLGGGPAWFEVKSKSGLIYEYGNAVSARALLSPTSPAHLWALNKVRDRVGNSMVIHYAPSSGTLFPVEIQYTLTPSTGAAYSYSVVFTYASLDASDRTSGYVAGLPYSADSRLSTIEVRLGSSTGELLRIYRLNYSDSPTTGRSRLASVQECAGASGTDCKGPTVITYQNGQAGVPNPGATLVTVTNAVGSMFVDVNADGCTDMLYGLPSGSVIRWFARLCDPGYPLFASTPIDTGIIVNQNDDILADDFAGIGQITLLAPTGGVWHHYRWSGQVCCGSFSATSTGLTVDPNRLLAPNPADGRWPSFASADVNGDGRPDMVWAATYNGVSSIYTRLNASSGGSVSFASQMVEAYPTPSLPDRFAGIFGNNSAPSAELQRIDFNGDGRDDVVMGSWRGTVPISGSAHQLISGGGTFFSGPAIQNVLGWPRALNWNNDACTDFVAPSQLYVSACNGSTGQTLSTSAGNGALIDWDGDGRTDLLAPSGSQWYVHRSMGTSIEAPVPTGIPYPGTAYLIPVEHNGDGLIDLVAWDGNGAIRVGLHRGAYQPPDLVSEIADAFGNRFLPVYRNLRSAVHRGTYPGLSGPVFPDVPYNGPLNVVVSFVASDGRGGLYSNVMLYYAPRKHLQGRGFLGFAARRTYESRNGLYRYEEYRQDFPFIGAISAERTMQPNETTVIRSLSNTYGRISLDTATYNRREFPYVAESALRSYEVGGPFNGSHIFTRTTTNTFDNWGTLTNQVISTAEVGTGLYAGGTYTERVFQEPGTVINDTATWCLSKPTQTSYIKGVTLPVSNVISRRSHRIWDTTLCRLSAEITHPNNLLYEVTTSVGYDTFGNVNSVTRTPVAGQGQAPNSTMMDWGSSGQFPRTVTNATSHVTRIDWDVRKGVQVGVTDRNNHTTEWQHDAFGRLTREERPDGTATQFTLTACNAGNSYCGGASDLRYRVQVEPRDTANNVIRTNTQSFDGLDRLRYDAKQLLGGGMSTATATYDALGRIVSRSEPATSLDPVWYTSTTYDLRNRPTRIERQASEVDTSPSITQISYQGLTIVKTDPLLRSSSAIFSPVGQIVRTVNAAGSDTDYQYDAFGNLVKVRDALGNETNAVFTQDFLSSLTDPDMGTWTYQYYPMGELKSQTNARGQTTAFTYDALSRPLTRVEPEGSTTWTWDTAVNGVGQLRSVQSPGSYGETYSFDSLGRLSQRTVVAGGGTYLINQSYSATTGDLETMTFPTSTAGVRFKLRYGYQNGELRSIRDYTGNVLGTTYWQANATNARGQIIDEQLGNGLRTISGYDRIAGWIENRTSGPGGGSARQNVEYAWNKTGTLSQRRDLNINHTEDFYYDVLDRLDYSQLDGATNLDVSYDAIGNITSKSGVGAYTYHATKKHAVVAAGSNTYGYDADGNMTTRNGASITWSSYNLPLNINQSGGNYSQLEYGADRNRYKHVTFSPASGPETTILIGDLFEHVSRGGGVEHKHYIKAPGGVVAVHNRKSTGVNETVYLLRDHLGSVQAVTNSAGYQMSLLSNDAFGKRRNGGTWTGVPAASAWTTINNTTHRSFTGHEHLDHVGLIHMNGRVYDPVIGRFLSADPFVQALYADQSLNRYSYALNSPLSYTDPSGFGWDDFDVFDWGWDLGWGDWFDGDAEWEYSCSSPGSERCALWAYTIAILDACGMDRRCREEFEARYPPPFPPRPAPPAPTPTPPDPVDELPPLPDPEQRPIPGPAEGVPGLGTLGNALAGRLASAVDSIPGYRTAEDFATYWAELADRSWNEGWPGDGSIEASLAGLPPVIGSPVSRLTSIRNAVQLGRSGEAAVRAIYNIGAKTRILVNGRARVPDGLTATVLSEVKNVRSLGYTRQLQDYARYAADKGLRFDLYVRPGAKLSPKLLAVEEAGLLNIIEIPF